MDNKGRCFTKDGKKHMKRCSTSLATTNLNYGHIEILSLNYKTI